MKISIEQQSKNPLMKREEVWVSVEHEGAATPKRKELLPHLVKALKAKENLVMIRKIFSETGRTRSKAKVFVFSNADDVPKAMAEKMQRQLKKGKQPEAKPAEKKAEAPKEGPKKEDEKPEAEEKKPEKEGPAEAPKKEGKPKEETPKKEEPKEEAKAEGKPAEKKEEAKTGEKKE